MEIVETLADGTRILSNGFRLLPSVGTLPSGKPIPLNEMTESQRSEWNDRLMKKLSRDMSETI